MSQTAPPTADRVARVIERHDDPALSTGEIASALGAPTPLVRERLEELRRQGRVERKELPVGTCWWPADSGGCPYLCPPSFEAFVASR